MEHAFIIHGNFSKVWKVLIFLLLLFNNETLANNLCSFVYQPAKYVALVLFVWYIINSTFNHSFHRMDGGPFLSLVFFSVCLLLLYIKDSTSKGYLLLALGVITSFSIADTIEFKELSLFFVDCMSLLSLYSLVCTYLLKPIMPLLSAIFKVVSNSAGVRFYNAIFCYVHVGSEYYRNYGIFREPGVFAYFICIAIVFLILNRSNEEHYKILMALLVITLISTFSTAGYVALAIIVIWITFFRKEISSKLAVPIVIGLMFFSIISSSYIIDNPFNKLSSSNSSYQYRLESMSTALRLIIDNPLGYGINQGLIAMRNNYGLASYHNTNTWTTLGCYLGVPFMICAFAGIWKFCKNLVNSSFVMLMIIILLSSEILIYNPFFYILVFYGYKNLKQEEYHEDISN